MRLEDLMLDKSKSNTAFHIVDDVKTWTCEELITRIRRLANYLRNCGLKKEDNVGILMDNSVDYFVAVIAVLSVDACVVPLYLQMPPLTLSEIIAQCDISTVITTSKRKRFIDGFCKNCIESEGNDSGDLLCLAERNACERAFLFTTSGTTGKPKIVELSHEAVLNNIEKILDYLPLREDDAIYVSKAMQYVSTMVGEIFLGLQAGCRLYMFNPTSPPSVTLRRIEKFRPTFLGTTSTMLCQMVNVAGSYCLESIRYLQNAGSGVSEELLIQAEKKFPCAKILNVYGMTEAGPRVSACRPEEKRVHGSAGKAIKDVTIEIRSEKGEKCAAFEKGEIWIKTSSMMTGYYKQEHLTREKIKNGWIKSGDVGFMDRQGYLFVVGRMDDVIVRNGQKIDPSRVENCICQMDAVDECIVFGIPDNHSGSRIICAITLIDPAATLTLGEIITFSSQWLAPNECPVEAYVWPEIPRQINGKISRHLAIQKYLGRDQN